MKRAGPANQTNLREWFVGERKLNRELTLIDAKEESKIRQREKLKIENLKLVIG